jgi:hypothetical protein
MPEICTLRPNVTREEAIREFNSRGVRGFFRAMLLGRLRRVAKVYIPFRLYRAHITDGAKHQSVLLALDAFSGGLDLYSFDSVPDAGATVRLESRNHPQPRLPEVLTREMVIARIRRIVFRTGFFRVRDLHIRVELVLPELHVPYWVGFRGDRGHARVAVMDAVRRRLEGARLRQLVLEWLAG